MRLTGPLLLIALAGACATGTPAEDNPSDYGGSGGDQAGSAGAVGGADGGLAGDSGSAGSAGAQSGGSAGAFDAGGAGGSANSAGSDPGGGAAGTSGGAGADASAGNAGEAGSAGTAGVAGSTGSGGASGSGGSAGTAGSAGVGGSAGKGGSAGTGGTAGTGGSAGKGGSAGTSGTAGSGGTGGTGGSSGTGGAPCIPPVSGSCDDIPQCGCFPGQNCDVISVSGETACVAGGQAPPYNNCNASTTCQVGTSCVGGVCKPFCASTLDCPGSIYRVCDQVVGGTTPIPEFKVCTQQCNPRTPQQSTGGFAACGPNTQCVVYDYGTSDCMGPAGSGVQGTLCASASDCQPGYNCVDDGYSNKCLRWCTSNADCSGWLLCNPFTPALYVGSAQYGVCL